MSSQSTPTRTVTASSSSVPSVLTERPAIIQEGGLVAGATVLGGAAALAWSLWKLPKTSDYSKMTTSEKAMYVLKNVLIGMLIAFIIAFLVVILYRAFTYGRNRAIATGIYKEGDAQRALGQVINRRPAGTAPITTNA